MIWVSYIALAAILAAGAELFISGSSENHDQGVGTKAK